MTAYYNEFDPFAAAWLRELIKMGAIAPGDVDERSIADVRPDDLRGYVQCHFFAGIGGWSLAARLAGWPDDRPLWTGSCPCQPFSVAGKGAGTDDPRHLWPHFFRLIRACRPPVVMGEQVAGKAGYGWLDGVLADLAGEDYACRGVDIPACAVDAPHIRQRLYWIACRDVADPEHAREGRRQLRGPSEGPGPIEQRAPDQPAGPNDRPRDMADAAGERRSEVRPSHDALEEQRPPVGRRTVVTPWTGTDDGGLRGGLRQPDAESRPPLAHSDQGRPRGRTDEPAGHDGDGAAAGRQEGAGGAPGCDEGGVADAASKGRYASALGRICGEAQSERPRHGELERLHGLQRNGTFWSGAEWIACHDGKARRAGSSLSVLVDGLPVRLADCGGSGTAPGPVSLLAHGVTNRVQKWRGFGNAIVPQVAAEVIAAFLDVEHILPIEDLI